MIYIVANMEDTETHIIEAPEGVRLAGISAVCGKKSYRWQLYMWGLDVKLGLCRECNRIVFGSNGQNGQAQPVEGS